MQADLEAVRRKFAQTDDADLLRVAHADEDDYIPEVIALARAELDRRGIDHARPDVREQVRGDLADERQHRLAHEGRPLSGPGRLGCAIAGVVIALIAAAVMMSNGRKRAAQDAIAWGVIGLLAKLALIGLAAMMLR